MAHLPFPLTGSFVGDKNGISQKTIRYIIFTMWCIHFIRRIVEVFFVHIYNRRMPLVETIGGPVYYWTFALFNAWAIDRDVYTSTCLSLVAIGTILFIFGEIGNGWCHYKLRCFRTGSYDSSLLSLKTGHVVPHGGLFNFVSCPHYFCEIVTWLGFFMAAFTLWALLFLLCTVLTLVIYSKKKHNLYQTEFDGKDGKPFYPNRKSLVPFLI